MTLLFKDIDEAFEHFNAFKQAISSQRPAKTEADTRLKLIDPLFSDVLGWPLDSISCEPPTTSGFIDYLFHVNGVGRLVVEAKREHAAFGIASRKKHNSYALDRAVLTQEPVRGGILQAAEYCGNQNVELACVTNGLEFVVFRGTRPGEGVPTMSGHAFVFRSLQDISERFPQFYDLLSPQSVLELRYRSMFRSIEDRRIPRPTYCKAVLPSDAASILSTDHRARDFERVLKKFFERMTSEHDAEMLRRCFVVTPESQDADERLARISTELISQIDTIDTDAAATLVDVMEQARVSQRAEFVLLVGREGCGKSTFVDRFFNSILPKELSRKSLVATANLAQCIDDPGAVNAYLDDELLRILEEKLYENGYPTYDDLMGLYYREYESRANGAYKYEYEKDKKQFKIDFGRWMNEQRESNRHAYILKLVTNIVRSRHMLPCIVFDNADHFSTQFQETAFQYARAMFERAACLVVMPITDRTSWQLSTEGALRPVEATSFYLPSPDAKKVIERRIEYIAEQISGEDVGKSSSYELGRGVPIEIERLSSFVSVLNKVFVETGNASRWIGQLANYDVRKTLELVRDVASSPHIPFADLLQAYYDNTAGTLPDRGLKQAMILGKHDRFVADHNRFVRNIYALTDSVGADPFRSGGSPLIGLRILKNLSQEHDDEVASYVPVRELIEWLNGFGVASEYGLHWLSRMLESGLLWASDPTIRDASLAGTVKITPSGELHLAWGTSDDVYLSAMAAVTHVTDKQLYDRIRGELIGNHGELGDARRAFVDYLIAEDARTIQGAGGDQGQQMLLGLLHQLGSGSVRS